MTRNEHNDVSIISRRRALGLGLGGAAAALLAACSAAGKATTPESALSAPEKSLLDAAKKEGQVVVYTSSEQSVVDALTKGFQDRYGVLLQVQRLNSAQLQQRYTAEAQANTFACDAVLSGDPTIADDFAAKGWVSKINGAPAAAQWPAKFLSDNYAIVSINPYTLGINTDLVKESAITDWSMLTDPKWQGKIVTVDLKQVGIVAFPAWDILRQAYGDDFLRKIGTQQLRLFDSGPSSVQQLAAGSGALYYPCSATTAASLSNQGAPVKTLLPGNAPISGAEVAVYMSAKGPHPNAAKLFANYCMITEGQQALNKVASSPVDAPGAPPLPAKYERPDYQRAKQTQKELISLLAM
ncbi:ABC transporter substrate-binding protein [Amycolatopsis acidicola]|uniref:ABC transporter substrate-binding protein n=1 Tax=Amycolatopsis acidicola TaxID=2596893 RepID=UPI001407E9B7|nr:extracellular solute-binding protein [Amycolatopsis acidicola]